MQLYQKIARTETEKETVLNGEHATFTFIIFD